MRRFHKPRISPLETFLNRASQPIPSNLRPYYLSPNVNNDAATALLNTLSPTDVLHLRLVSQSVHDWTNERLDELFGTLYYTITITKQETGTIVRTPTALAPLRTIGRSCTHFVITILSPTPPSIPTSSRTPTPTQQSYTTSTSTATPPKPASYPHLLTHFLKHLLTHLLPSLHTLTLALPEPRSWRPEPTTHSTLVQIRQALESLPPTTNLRTLNFNPISLVHLVSLRWRGLSAYGGEAGWTGSRFWGGVRALDVAVFVPLEACAIGRRGGKGGLGRGERGRVEEGGDREVREGHVRMAMKVLHDWLTGFGRGLELLGFEWLALPEPDTEEEEDWSVQGNSSSSWQLNNALIPAFGNDNNDYTLRSNNPKAESKSEPAMQITGPNPLTLYINPTPFSFTFAPSYPPSVPQHQHQIPRRPLPTSASTQTSTLTTTQPAPTHPSAPNREKRFSAPPIRWVNLSEVWLRGVEVGTLATWMAGVRSLEKVYVWEDGIAVGEEDEEDDGGRWVRFEMRGVKF